MRRSTPFLVAALAATSGCAVQPRPVPYDVAGHFAATLDTAGTGVEAAVQRLEGFERATKREETALAFGNEGMSAPARARGRRGSAAEPVAMSTRARGARSDPGMAVVADTVFQPAFAALHSYAGQLASLANGGPPLPPSGDPATLMKDAQDGVNALYAATGRPLPPAIVAAGVAGIGTLATPPAPGTVPSQLAAARHPSMVAVATLLREVVGTDRTSGLRGELEENRADVERTREALLAAVRRDPRHGVFDRYMVYHLVSDARDTDPANRTLGGMQAVFETMVDAHATLAQPNAPGAEARINAFGTAVEELEEQQGAIHRGASGRGGTMSGGIAPMAAMPAATMASPGMSGATPSGTMPGLTMTAPAMRGPAAAR